jgi:hypothetical protein
MRLIFVFIFLSLYCLCCKNQSVHDREMDKLSPVIQKDTVGLLSVTPEKPCFIVRGRLDLPVYSICLISQYMLPTGSLGHDSSFYFKANYVVVTRKSGKITDSLKVDVDDLSNCHTCSVILRNLTDTLQIQPLFIQLVTPGLDLNRNTYIGYRGGKLKEFFHLEDTQDYGVDLQKTDESTLYGRTFGIDEVIGAVEHNYPVSIDLKTFKVSHPLPDKQYIGFKTDAIESFRAYRLIKGQVDSLLISVKAGDSVTIDTFYRARQKVRLLVADSMIVEIKLETAQKKIRHPPAAG